MITNMCTEINIFPEHHEAKKKKNRNYKGRDTTDARKQSIPKIPF